EFTQFDSEKSMIRYLPPNGTAGLARTEDRIERRSPSPPARISAIVRFTRALLLRPPIGIVAPARVAPEEQGVRGGSRRIAADRGGSRRIAADCGLHGSSERLPPSNPSDRHPVPIGRGIRVSRSQGAR